MQNINIDNSDPFYRYKMPRIVLKIEGAGNGIKTILVNITDIAKSLDREAIVIAKFFGFELGSQVTINDKNNKYIINGRHDDEKLEHYLHIFIRKYVLCGKCKNPETFFFGKGPNKDLYMECKACGYITQNDQTHRITSYIIKKSLTDTSQTKNKVKNSKLINTCNEEKIIKEGNDDKIEVKDDNIEDKFALALERFILDASFQDSQAKEVATKFKNLASELSIQDSSAIMVQILLSNDTILNMKKYKHLFKEYINFNAPSEIGFLYGLERVLSSKQKTIIPKMSGIIQWLYENELISEPSIHNWFERPRSKYRFSKDMSLLIREYSQSVITWLKEAEEQD